MEDQPPLITDHREQQRYKTLGVRLEEDLHAKLSFIAQLTDSTITDEIRRAIEARVDAAQSDPDLVARAESVRAEIEREATARQQAIAGFFGKKAVGGAAAEAQSKPSRPAKAAAATPKR